MKKLDLGKAPPLAKYLLSLVGGLAIALCVFFVFNTVFGFGKTAVPTCSQDEILTSMGFDLCATYKESIKKNTNFTVGISYYPESQQIAGVQNYGLWTYDKQAKYLLETPAIVQKLKSADPLIVVGLSTVIGALLYPAFLILKKPVGWIHTRWGFRNIARNVFNLFFHKRNVKETCVQNQ